MRTRSPPSTVHHRACQRDCSKLVDEDVGQRREPETKLVRTHRVRARTVGEHAELLLLDPVLHIATRNRYPHTGCGCRPLPWAGSSRQNEDSTCQSVPRPWPRPAAPSTRSSEPGVLRKPSMYSMPGVSSHQVISQSRESRVSADHDAYPRPLTTDMGDQPLQLVERTGSAILTSCSRGVGKV